MTISNPVDGCNPEHAACSNWCNPSFVDAHCKWCHCSACAWCRPDHPSSSFPGSGRWDCAATPPHYIDSVTGVRTTSALDVASLRPQVSGKWVVFIGDSSMRMLFHLVIGVLTSHWTRWPETLSAAGHGPDPDASCLDRHDNADGPCMEDAYHKGMRLTAVWSDYGEDPMQLKSFRALANQTLGSPDLLVLGIGAWWAWHRPTETKAYGAAVARQVAEIDRLFAPRSAPYFRGLWAHSTRKVFAATTSCKIDYESDPTTNVVNRLNMVAKSHVLSRPGWVWHARDHVTFGVCSWDDCAGSHHTSRFHPGGYALNVLVNMLLGKLAGSGERARE